MENDALHPSSFIQIHKDFISYIASEKGLTPNSIEAYGRDTANFLNYCEGQGITDVTSIQENHIVGYLSVLNSKKYASSSIHRMLISIKVLFKFLKRESILKVNPTQHLSTPKLWQLIPEVLTLDEMEKLLEQPDTEIEEGCRDRAILEVLYGSGLRVSELCNLTINSIGDDSVKVFGKGRKERIIPIGKKALEAVDEYLTNFRDATANEKNQALFVNSRGRAVNRFFVWKMIKEYARDAGITKNISPHTMRHSFATHLVDHGAELRVIQEMLGHASISSTDRYTHISKTHLQEAFNAFHPRR